MTTNQKWWQKEYDPIGALVGKAKEFQQKAVPASAEKKSAEGAQPAPAASQPKKGVLH